MSGKKKTILIVALLLVVFIGSISYALWSVTLEQTDSNIVKTGCFTVDMVEETDEINLPEEYPVLDSEGKTYTPFTLCTIREYSVVTGWTIFGIVWGLAVIGIVLNSIDLKKYKIFSMICYLVMGWCILARINIVIESLGPIGFTLLLSGGIVYTIGAIFYGVGKKKKWMHSVFHIACVIASLLQLLCVLLYVV